MGKEIERKFIVDEIWMLSEIEGLYYRQGYIETSDGNTVRVRTVGTTREGDRGYITVKGPSTGISCSEFEYEIPIKDAREMLDELCAKPQLEKLRRTVTHEGLVWEYDEFLAENAGLYIAEVELESEDQKVSLPPWVGKEVSGDPRYYNVNLIKNPYKDWWKMVDLKKSLDKFNESKKEINQYFDGLIYDAIRDMTDEYWTLQGEYSAGNYDYGSPKPFARASSVGWSQESPLENPDIPEDDYREHVYGDEVQSVVRKEHFTLVTIHTSTGDGKEDLIFDNSKEIPENKLNP